MTHYYDIVNVALEVTKYNGIKLAIKYTISDSKTGEIRCVGSSEHCFLDKTGKPVSLKRSYPEIDAILEKFNEIKEA